MNENIVRSNPIESNCVADKGSAGSKRCSWACGERPVNGDVRPSDKRKKHADEKQNDRHDPKLEWEYMHVNLSYPSTPCWNGGRNKESVDSQGHIPFIIGIIMHAYKEP